MQAEDLRNPKEPILTDRVLRLCVVENLWDLKQPISRERALRICVILKEQFSASLHGKSDFLIALGMIYPDVTHTPIYQNHITAKGLQRC